MDNRMQLGTKFFFRFTLIFSALVCTFLLSSCHHARRPDGPPNFYVDETKVPNAVPRREALAKYGNMPMYRVFGKRYYTLKSSKNYEQVGIASWYGTKFHAQRTSSGERYNMLAMTAAHKTLPLPTYVEVTNLRNKKQIIVKVNDRGPFEGNRIIDLSYVAAKKLGMLGGGTTMVKIKAIDPDTYGRARMTRMLAKKTERAFQPSNRHQFNAAREPYWRGHTQTAQRTIQTTVRTTIHTLKPMYLQVGAFKNRNNAEQLQHRLASLLATPVNISSPKATSKLYRVHVGPIRDVATANKITQQLQGIGIKSNRV